MTAEPNWDEKARDILVAWGNIREDGSGRLRLTLDEIVGLRHYVSDALRSAYESGRAKGIREAQEVAEFHADERKKAAKGAPAQRRLLLEERELEAAVIADTIRRLPGARAGGAREGGSAAESSGPAKMAADLSPSGASLPHSSSGSTEACRRCGGDGIIAANVEGPQATVTCPVCLGTGSERGGTA